MKKLTALSAVLGLVAMTLFGAVLVKADDEPSTAIAQMEAAPAPDDQGTTAQPEPQEQMQSQPAEEQPQQDPPVSEQAPEPGPRY